MSVVTISITTYKNIVENDVGGSNI